MKKITLLSAAFFGGLLSSQAQVTTDPVGFVSVTIAAKSDAVLAVPLNRASEFKGTVQSISGTTITVVGSPAWTTNAFGPLVTASKTYALQIASGSKEGLTAKILSNTSNSVTVQLDAGDDLTGITTDAVDGAGNGAQVDIMPYWTPGALVTGVPTGTEFLGFAGVGAGINKASTQLYGYTGTGWEDEITSNDATNVAIAFGTAFILRNNANAVTTVSMVGSVPMSASRILIKTLGNNQDQDLRIGYISPVPESITALGIPAVTGDAILVFDNAAAGKNKSASAIYAYDNGQWVDDITGTPITSAVKLQPGNGIVYRKFRTATPQTVVWQKLPSYLQ